MTHDGEENSDRLIKRLNNLHGEVMLVGIILSSGSFYTAIRGGVAVDIVGIRR